MQKELEIVVFHGGEDAEFAHRLADDLRQAGFSAEASSNIDALAKYDYLLLVLSADSIQHDIWSQPFHNFATSQRYMGIAHTDTTPLPKALTDVDWVDFDLGYQVAFNGLLLMLEEPQIPIKPKEVITPYESVLAQRAILQQMVIAITLFILAFIVLLLLYN